MSICYGKDFSVIDYEVQDNVAVIVVNNPPVNALSFSVRAGLLHFLMKAENSKEVCGIIIACEGRTFIAGADISEFEVNLKSLIFLSCWII